MFGSVPLRVSRKRSHVSSTAMDLTDTRSAIQNNSFELSEKRSKLKSAGNRMYP